MTNYGIIYKATNIENNKVYIGQTIETLEIRKNKHFYKAKKFKEKNITTNHFFNAINEYGKDAFKWEIIDVANNQKELNEKEQFWIKEYDAINSGYNIREGGLSRKGGNAFAIACGSKPFLLYDYKGNFIGEFINKREVERQYGINHSDLSQMILNDKGFSNGYAAFDKDNFTNQKLYDRINIYKMYHKDKFIGIDDEGNQIGPFTKIAEANKFLGVKNSHIGEVLSGKRKKDHGYIFKYVKEEE